MSATEKIIDYITRTPELREDPALRRAARNDYAATRNGDTTPNRPAPLLRDLIQTRSQDQNDPLAHISPQALDPDADWAQIRDRIRTSFEEDPDSRA